MWYPDLTITKWFKIYPTLKEMYPKICECGVIRADALPFVSKNWVGIKYGNCKCGKKCSEISIPRNEKFKNEVRQLLLKL